MAIGKAIGGQPVFLSNHQGRIGQAAHIAPRALEIALQGVCAYVAESVLLRNILYSNNY
jgi:hypothetical protein